MPERGWDTDYPNHPFIQKLPALGKWLHFYLGNNSHCSQSGLYHITLKTMAFESGIDESELSELMVLLKEKIVWYPEHDLIWVKNFIKRQTKNPSFLISVGKSLTDIHYPEIIKELLDYNRDRFGIEIPLEQGNKTVPPPPLIKEKGQDNEDYKEELRKEYTDIDFDDELKKFDLYWSEGKRELKRPKLALRNWMNKAREFRKEKPESKGDIPGLEVTE